MARPADRSYGYLPLTPLQHGAPTAVGLIDLDSKDGVSLVNPRDRARARDQLLLARLHGQPVAAVHVPTTPGAETRADLLEVIWRDGSHEILSHIERCGCLPLPSGPGQLDAILRDGNGACPERLPARPAGHAALIICTAGRTEVLERALKSFADMRCDDWELILVDNRPSDPATKALVDRLAPVLPVAIRYVAEPLPGLARARNRGVEAATDAAFVAFTDDDVAVDEGWLGWLLAPFVDPRVQAVTGLVMPLMLESAAQKRFELYAGFGKGVTPDSYVLLDDRDEDRFQFLYPYWGGMFGSGNSMAFRRDALLAAGGFDPALGAGTPTGGGEDIAAFTDIILAGGVLVYEPRSVCWHEHRGDAEALERQIRNYGIGLTAVFWRYLWKSPHFTLTVLRSLRRLPRLVSERSTERDDNKLPDELWKLESRGRLLGPWRYTLSRLRVLTARFAR